MANDSRAVGLTITKFLDSCSYTMLYALGAMLFSDSVRREGWRK